MDSVSMMAVTPTETGSTAGYLLSTVLLQKDVQGYFCLLVVKNSVQQIIQQL